MENEKLIAQLQNEERYVHTANMLKLLSNPNRLMILTILAESPRAVNEIHELLSKVSTISQSSLSQHLALLRAHQIVNFKKHGQKSAYFITEKYRDELLEILNGLGLLD